METVAKKWEILLYLIYSSISFCFLENQPDVTCRSQIVEQGPCNPLIRIKLGNSSLGFRMLFMQTTLNSSNGYMSVHTRIFHTN